MSAVRKEVKEVEALLDEEGRQKAQEGSEASGKEPPFGAAGWREECKVGRGRDTEFAGLTQRMGQVQDDARLVQMADEHGGGAGRAATGGGGPADRVLPVQDAVGVGRVRVASTAHGTYGGAAADKSWACECAAVE